MNWNHSVLRKFSGNGHFRLLGQLRKELISQPLIRDKHTRKLHLQSKPIHGSSIRSNSRPNALAVTTEKSNSTNIEKYSTDNNDSFKERLNSIDLR